MRRAFLTTLIAVPALASAQAVQQSATLPTEQQVYSVYATRHAATTKLAELGVAKATNKDVRKFAERLGKDEADAATRLQAEAAKAGIQITPVGHDTTSSMLASITADLQGKSGTAFDSVWTDRAHVWLTTLVLDNNINVSGKLPDGPLKKFAQAYSTFQFHLLSDAASLKKKLR
jgi:predicted outer membrane protein